MSVSGIGTTGYLAWYGTRNAENSANIRFILRKEHNDALFRQGVFAFGKGQH